MSPSLRIKDMEFMIFQAGMMMRGARTPAQPGGTREEGGMTRKRTAAPGSASRAKSLRGRYDCSLKSVQISLKHLQGF